MNRKIAVAGTGYVGLSLAVLLAQKNQVTAVDIIPEKVEMLNHKKSPIQDDYIERRILSAEGYEAATGKLCGCSSEYDVCYRGE